MKATKQTLGIKLVALGMSGALALASLAGCSSGESATDQTTGSEQTETPATTNVGSEVVEVANYTSGNPKILIDTDSLFSARDLDPTYSETDVVEIALADGATNVSGNGAVVDGDTITIKSAGIYRVSGTLSDGQIVVDAAKTDKVQIVLSGANITCSSNAAIYAKSADKVFLTLEDTNALTTSGEFVQTDSDHNVDGVVFSACDLTVNGEGSLGVMSAAGHGIVAKDELTLASGTMNINASGTGMQANDWIAVADGTYTISAGTDGLHAEHSSNAEKGFIYIAEGTFDITAGSDGFDTKNMMQVDGGNITVAAGDDGLHADLDFAVNGGNITATESYEGLEGARIYITAGNISLVSSDDGLNATGDDSVNTTGDLTAEEAAEQWQNPDGTSGFGGKGGPGFGGGMMDADGSAEIVISGGYLEIDAQGDGIDSNGYLTITDGEIYVSGPTSDGDSPLDCGISASIEGGTIVSVGSSGMLETFGANSTQPSITLALDSAATGTVRVLNSDGNTVCEYSPTKQYRAIIVSTPDIQVGETYTVEYGGATTEIEVGDTVTTSDSFGMGMGGGFGGGMGGSMGGDPGMEGDMGGGPGMGDRPGGGRGGDFGGGDPAAMEQSAA